MRRWFSPGKTGLFSRHERTALYVDGTWGGQSHMRTALFKTVFLFHKHLLHVSQCISIPLEHGCAKVSHCVTVGDVTSPTSAVHYVSMTCSEHREALTGAPTEHGVHKLEFTVQGGSAQFATEQVGRLQYVTAVDGGLEAFPVSIVICAPVLQSLLSGQQLSGQSVA